MLIRFYEEKDLRTILESYGHSFTSFAKKLGVNRSYLYAVANNIRSIDSSTWEKWLRLMKK